jgi:hypothetical protein
MRGAVLLGEVGAHASQVRGWGQGDSEGEGLLGWGGGVVHRRRGGEHASQVKEGRRCAGVSGAGMARRERGLGLQGMSCEGLQASAQVVCVCSPSSWKLALHLCLDVVPTSPWASACCSYCLCCCLNDSVVTAAATAAACCWWAGSRDWQRPDKSLRPAGTVALEGGVACETDFEDCGEDVECDVEIAGAKVPLQRVSITLPPNTADAGGLTFVLRR